MPAPVTPFFLIARSRDGAPLWVHAYATLEECQHQVEMFFAFRETMDSADLYQAISGSGSIDTLGRIERGMLTRCSASVSFSDDAMMRQCTHLTLGQCPQCATPLCWSHLAHTCGDC